MSDLFATASIDLHNLSKHFGDIRAVDDVSLHVEPGNLICLLGPSGCGKTTTLRMIAGFEHPTSGHITIGGEDITDVPAYARPTAMVFQNYALFPHMSIYDNVAYGLRARRVKRAEVDSRVREVIRLMELEGQEHKSPPQLSGGQQQRVALARALVIRPKVLLFDEPLSNLDAQLRVRMRSEIRSIQHRLGITSVYVTHDQEEAFSIADLVAIMNRGKLIQLGTPRELYRRPADRFVAEFVGLSNIVPIEVVSANAGEATIRVFGQTLRSRRPPLHSDNTTALVLRPEALRLLPDGAPGTPARVVTMTYVGPIARYVVAVGAEEEQLLTVDLYNPGPEEFFPEGTTVSLQLPDEVPALLG
jgi:iron(III) transport system ATP-binding protein